MQSPNHISTAPTSGFAEAQPPGGAASSPTSSTPQSPLPLILRAIARLQPACVLLAFLTLAAPQTASGSDSDPAMRFANTNRLGRPFSKDPCVIRFQDRYLLYFSLPPVAPEQASASTPRGWAIGIAQSTDRLHWAQIAEILPEQPCEQNGICAPGAIVLDGRVHLFYQTYGNGPRDAICHAVSTNGLTFTRDPSNPVFRPSGNWNSGRAIDAEVFEYNNQLLLYFATRDPSSKTQMLGIAAAPRTSDFSRSTWNQLTQHPILQPELPWETRCIEAPSLCRRGPYLYLFYGGGYNNDPQQIGVATSTNAINWTRLSSHPLLPNGPPGSWNSSESGHPGVFVDTDGTTLLYFQGNPDKGRTWELSCLEIRWTPNPNPSGPESPTLHHPLNRELLNPKLSTP